MARVYAIVLALLCATAAAAVKDEESNFWQLSPHPDPLFENHGSDEWYTVEDLNELDVLLAARLEEDAAQMNGPPGHGAAATPPPANNGRARMGHQQQQQQVETPKQPQRPQRPAGSYPDRIGQNSGPPGRSVKDAYQERSSMFGVTRYANIWAEGDIPTPIPVLKVQIRTTFGVELHQQSSMMRTAILSGTVQIGLMLDFKIWQTQLYLKGSIYAKGSGPKASLWNNIQSFVREFTAIEAHRMSQVIERHASQANEADLASRESALQVDAKHEINLACASVGDDAWYPELVDADHPAYASFLSITEGETAHWDWYDRQKARAKQYYRDSKRVVAEKWEDTKQVVRDVKNSLKARLVKGIHSAFQKYAASQYQWMQQHGADISGSVDVCLGSRTKASLKATAILDLAFCPGIYISAKAKAPQNGLRSVYHSAVGSVYLSMGGLEITLGVSRRHYDSEAYRLKSFGDPEATAWRITFDISMPNSKGWHATPAALMLAYNNPAVHKIREMLSQKIFCPLKDAQNGPKWDPKDLGTFLKNSLEHAFSSYIVSRALRGGFGLKSRYGVKLDWRIFTGTRGSVMLDLRHSNLQMYIQGDSNKQSILPISYRAKLGLLGKLRFNTLDLGCGNDGGLKKDQLVVPLRGQWFAASTGDPGIDGFEPTD